MFQGCRRQHGSGSLVHDFAKGLSIRILNVDRSKRAVGREPGEKVITRCERIKILRCYDYYRHSRHRPIPRTDLTRPIPHSHGYRTAKSTHTNLHRKDNFTISPSIKTVMVTVTGTDTVQLFRTQTNTYTDPLISQLPNIRIIFLFTYSAIYQFTHISYVSQFTIHNLRFTTASLTFLKTRADVTRTIFGFL